MSIERKEQLSRLGDMGKTACAIRLRAARAFAGLSQQEAALAVGIKKTTYNNMEQALAFPSREVMRYYYRAHRLDFNFLMNGDFAQLPADVQHGIFLALEAIVHEQDRQAS